MERCLSLSLPTLANNQVEMFTSRVQRRTTRRATRVAHHAAEDWHPPGSTQLPLALVQLPVLSTTGRLDSQCVRGIGWRRREVAATRPKPPDVLSPCTYVLKRLNDTEDQSMRLFSEGGTARIRSVDVWELGSIWRHPAETK